MNDLMTSKPEIFAELRRKMERMHARFQAVSPEWPLFFNPRDEQPRIKWPDYLAKPLR